MNSVWKSHSTEGNSGRVEFVPRASTVIATVLLPKSLLVRTYWEKTRQLCVLVTDREWEIVTVPLPTVPGGRSSCPSSSTRSNPGNLRRRLGFLPEVRRRMALALLLLARVEERQKAVVGQRLYGTAIVTEESAWN